MNVLNIFKKQRISMDSVLKNDMCKKLLEQYCDEYLSNTVSLIIIYETDNGKRKETFWKCAGIEPAQAILNLDQLHHRIQHEGIQDYD